MTTVTQFLNTARKHVGIKEGSSQHKALINAYNGFKPLPVGYTVKYTDDWCDAFITVVAIQSGATDIVGRECGVDRHIQIFKKLGIWDENGSKTPAVGDIITYNWDDATQANDGFADHIGIVESVSNGVITTIEGNYSNAVKRRAIRVGHGNIRGFARPKFSKEAVTPTTNNATYTVKSGDSLWAIANKHGMTLKQLKALNPHTGDLIRPGQKLSVGKTRTYTVKRGDTLSSIGARLGINWNNLAKKNDIKAPYVINPGDTLKY